jgi:hypothetical protein
VRRGPPVARIQLEEEPDGQMLCPEPAAWKRPPKVAYILAGGGILGDVWRASGLVAWKQAAAKRYDGSARARRPRARG